MQVLTKIPTSGRHGKNRGEVDPTNLDGLITAMGKRLQTEYLEGAIPYLRSHEPQLWARLEQLDREETVEALIEYEQLFFEGLQRYVAYLNKGRKAA
jgi:hypothetical protein